MIKEYKVDFEKKRKLKRLQIRKHPKWEKRKLIRYSLIFIMTMLLVGSIILPWTRKELFVKDIMSYTMNNEDIINIMFFLIVMVVIFICIPVFLYLRALRNTCADGINYHLDEILILDNEGIQYEFIPNNRVLNKGYVIDKINYKDIKKIVLNSYHNRLDVYGDMRLTMYSDYSKNKIQFTENHRDDKRRYYLYYENNEEFIKILEEKTNIKIQIINKKEL
jgi:cbb3-type cytochrome oxidase subunit 3